jgi:hypothetical protein
LEFKNIGPVCGLKVPLVPFLNKFNPFYVTVTHILIMQFKNCCVNTDDPLLGLALPDAGIFLVFHIDITL